MEELNCGPEQAVEWLKEEEAVKQIAGAKGIARGNARNGLYSALYGVNYDEDEAQSRLRDIPLAKRKLASLRIALMKRMLVQTADQSIPVIYLDLEAFWDLVKATPEYRVRKQAGLSPSSRNMRYTWAELKIAPETILASRGDLPLVDGVFFNEYCVRFAHEMQSLNSRRESVTEVRKKIVRDMVESILAVEQAGKNEWSLSEKETAMAMATYTQRNMFVKDLSMKDLKVGATYRKVTENLRNRFTDTHKAELQRIAEGVKEKPAKMSDYQPFLYTCSQYKDMVLREISSRLEQDQIYGWMQTNGFPGGVATARREMAKQRWERTVSQLMSEQNVAISANL